MYLWNINIVWWQIYTMSYFRFFVSKFKNAKKRRNDKVGLLCLFMFSLLSDFSRQNYDRKRARIRHIKSVVYSYFICRIFSPWRKSATIILTYLFEKALRHARIQRGLCGYAPSLLTPPPWHTNTFPYMYVKSLWYS
jgi:hypothetical protein